jgi:hypothetical protein
MMLNKQKEDPVSHLQTSNFNQIHICLYIQIKKGTVCVMFCRLFLVGFVLLDL